MNNEWKAAHINVASLPLKERALAGDCWLPPRGCQQARAPCSAGCSSSSAAPLPAPLKPHPGTHR